MHGDSHIEVERYFLSALLNSSDCGEYLVCGDWFHSEQDQKIYECIKDVYSGGRIDIIAEAHKRGIPIAAVVSLQELSETNPANWLVQLKDKYLKSQLRKLELQSEEFSGIEQFNLYESTLQEFRSELMQSGKANHYDSFLNELKSEKNLVTFGLSIDKYLAVVKADLIVIGARPSLGKTALMMTSALKQSVKFKVGIYSFETKPEGLVRRCVANIGSIGNNRLKRGVKSGNITTDELAMIESVTRKIEANENVEFPECKFDIDGLCQDIRLSDFDVVWIDYLQLIPGTRKGERRIEVEDVSRKLQRLAHDTGKVIICLAQLNRECEAHNRMPAKSDLREAGQLEQDADAIILLHVNTTNEQASTFVSQDEINEDTITVEMIIAKQRDGELKVVPVQFNRAYQRFFDRDVYHAEQTQIEPQF